MKGVFCGILVGFLIIINILFNLVNATELEYSLVNSIKGNGYPLEYYEIETEDGYILGTYRIPHGRNSKTREANRSPVLLVHGLLSISEAFLLLGPNKSLGYVLADNGFDVWLCNSRGTRYSRKHRHLNPDIDEKFWDFSWHEIGKYDLPATIDYVLNVTNTKKVQLVGHSQGATVFFVMGAERPEYNHKIELSIMLSPPVFLTRAPNGLLQSLLPFLPIIEKITDDLRIYEVVPRVLVGLLRQIGEIICGLNSTLLTTCTDVFTLLSGVAEEQIDPSLVALIPATHPGGCSTKQIFHYFQIINSGRFQQYDWGPIENRKRYGTEIPPDYNLRNVVAPVAIYYAEKDVFAQTVGVLRLAKILPNVVELYKVPYENWTHVDFIWGRDVYKYLYRRVLEVMKKYTTV